MPETKEKKDDEDLETWAMRLWRRMDRDGNSFVTRSELDSEEFRSIIRSVLTPAFKAGNMGGVEYMRSELNMTQAIHYCLRKADLNGDNALSYLEFRSFLRVLRHEDLGKSTAHLIFALFDLDQDGHISESEFREVFRFYQGHRPTEEQFQKEWAKLDARGEQRVNIAQYVKWLRASKNPIFHQHAPPEPDEVPEPEPPSPDMRKYLPRMTFSKSQARPKWNQRFNAGVNKNDRCPQGQRSYFSKTQSLPELQQHSRRAILQGSCLAAWPVALLHCWRLRPRARRAASRAGGARAALREGQDALRRFLDEWQSFRSREENTEGISLDELTTLAFVRCLAAIPEALLPIEWELQLRVRQLAEALQGRLRKAWCNVDEDAAVLRWTEASEEPGAAAPSKAEAGATTHVHGRNPISGIVHFLQDFLKEWPSPKDEDAASSQPLSTTQKRGNLIFAAWLLGSTALYAAATLARPRTE